MDMRLAVSYIPYATFSREKNGDIIMFAQFEEGDLLSKTFKNTESGNESGDNSAIPPLIREK